MPEIFCRVCRRWFAVGSAAAKLWRRLKVCSSTSLLRTGLARSRAAPLAVGIMPTTLQPLEKITPLLTPHTQRLRTLQLMSIPMGCLPAFKSFMDNSMPALRVLEATIEGSERHEAIETTLCLSPSRFPQLRELRLSGIQAFEDPTILTQLREVNACNCLGKNDELTTAVLVEAVAKMQHATNIWLYHMYTCDIDSAPVPSSAASDRATLDRVEKLTLCSRPRLLKTILSAIIIPPTAKVFIDCLYVRGMLYGYDPNLLAALPDDRSCLPVLAQVVSVVLTSTEKEISLKGFTTLDAGNGATCSDPQAELSVRSPEDLSDFAVAGLGDLPHIFHGAPLQSLSIETTPTIVLETDWRAIFATYPTLRKFHITAVRPVDEDGRLVEPPPFYWLVFAMLDPGSVSAAAHAPAEDLGALEGRSVGADTVLCPEHRWIVISGVPASHTYLLYAVLTTCMENRRQMLGRPDERLDGLVLHAEEHDDEAHVVRARDAFRKHMAPFFKDVSYQAADFEDFDSDATTKLVEEDDHN